MAAVREKLIEAEFDEQGRATIRLPELAAGKHLLLVSEVPAEFDATPHDLSAVVTPKDSQSIGLLGLPMLDFSAWPVDCRFGRDVLYAEWQEDKDER